MLSGVQTTATRAESSHTCPWGQSASSAQPPSPVVPTAVVRSGAAVVVAPAEPLPVAASVTLSPVGLSVVPVSTGAVRSARWR